MQTLVTFQDETGRAFHCVLSDDDWLKSGLINAVGQEVEVADEEAQHEYPYIVVEITPKAEDRVAGMVNEVTLRKKCRFN